MAVLGGFGQESLPELFLFSPFFNACLHSSALVSSIYVVLLPKQRQLVLRLLFRNIGLLPLIYAYVSDFLRLWLYGATPVCTGMRYACPFLRFVGVLFGFLFVLPYIFVMLFWGSGIYITLPYLTFLLKINIVSLKY